MIDANKPSWTFAAHANPPYAAIALTGVGDDEESALRDAIKNGFRDGLYTFDSGTYSGRIPASGLQSLLINPGILGGKGGWVAEYRWFNGDVVPPKTPYPCAASIWIERGKQS